MTVRAQPSLIEAPEGVDEALASQLEGIQRNFEALFSDLEAADSAANDSSDERLDSVTTDRLLGRDTAGTGAVEEISAADSITFSGSKSIKLSGDSASPGNSKYYGTNSSGTKGFHTLPDGVDGWTTVTKTTDDSVTNSATLVNDSELLFSTAAASAVWMIEAMIVYSANNATADFKLGFSVSTGTMYGAWNAINMSGGNAPQNTVLGANDTAATSATVQAGTDAADTARVFFITGTFRCSANATFNVQFAQNAATPGTTSKLRTGSLLRYKRIV